MQNELSQISEPLPACSYARLLRAGDKGFGEKWKLRFLYQFGIIEVYSIRKGERKNTNSEKETIK